MSFFPLPHIEDSPKRVRAYYSGVCLVGTRRAKLVWQHQWYPTYFFLDTELPEPYLELAFENSDRAVYNLKIGNKDAEAITCYKTGDLAGLFTINDFAQMDAWFEEQEQIFVHPKDPYKRIDILQSSLHIIVSVGGIEVANTRAPRLLFETGLPVRTYIPKTNCRMDLWEASDLKTRCPYKGEANYYDIVLPNERFENIVWWYPYTTLEASPIHGYACFYDEKVDVYVDGVKQQRPVSK